MIFEHWSKVVRNFGRTRPGEQQEGHQRSALAGIQHVSPATEQIQVSVYGGARVTRITHPYVSVRSWIRVMPEEGTGAVVAQRGDTAESEVTYYWSGFPGDRITAYLGGQGHYRPLDLGEIEISSFGMAQTFWSRRGALHLRGGISRSWLSDDDMEAGSKAATHRRLLHDHNHDDFRAEERFGVVWRKGDNHTARKFVKVGGVFAREYSRILTYKGSPEILVQYQEGHVIDEEGEPETGPSGEPLRVLGRWNNTTSNPTEWMLDELGNIWWNLPNEATVGWTTKIPKGTFRLEAGVKIQLGAISDVEISGQNMTLKARGTLYLDAGVDIILNAKGAIALKSPNIQLNDRVLLGGNAPF